MSNDLRKSSAAKWVLSIFGFLSTLAAALLISFKLMFGMGQPYPDLSTSPVYDTTRIETAIDLPFPPGMVAHSLEGRVFFTYHMLHKPERFTEATVFEWVNGAAVPFPSIELQSEFVGAMGITVDRQNRLWIIKPGALERKQTVLLAVDIDSGEIVLNHTFETGTAGFAQDMRVMPDGKTVILADTGLFEFSDASLIIFDVESRTARNVLKDDDTIRPQNWVIRKSNGRPYKLALGFLTFVVGVDGIALSDDGAWLYYAAMSHESLYRIPTWALLDDSQSDADLKEMIQFVGKKPMSDGIALLSDNTVIITDVENDGLAALRPDGKLITLTKDPRVDWADSVSVGPEGSIWFTDSRLTDLIDQFARPADEKTMRERGPYPIYRVSADELMRLE